MFPFFVFQAYALSASDASWAMVRDLLSHMLFIGKISGYRDNRSAGNAAYRAGHLKDTLIQLDQPAFL
jgi:hypothetical protein